MNRETLVQKNLDDLNIGYDLANISDSDILKIYIKGQINSLKDKYNLIYYKDSYLAFEYSIDLVLLINSSSILKDIENKDYFKNRLKELCDSFPELKKDEDISSII